MAIFCLQITVLSNPNLISEVLYTFATFFPFKASLINNLSVHLCCTWLKLCFPNQRMAKIFYGFCDKLYRTCQGAKKIIFTACHSGKLQLVLTSPNVISTSPKNLLSSRIDFTVLCYLNPSKNTSCPWGKLKQNSLAQQQNPLAPGFQKLLSLHTGLYTLEINY